MRQTIVHTKNIVFLGKSPTNIRELFMRLNKVGLRLNERKTVSWESEISVLFTIYYLLRDQFISYFLYAITALFYLFYTINEDRNE